MLFRKRTIINFTKQKTMKKYFFASVFALGMVTAVSAQTEDKEPALSEETQVEAVVNKDMAAVQEYKEIKATDLPQPVKDAVAKTFEDATITQAYKNEKGEYKLVIATASNGMKKASQTVYLNSKGEWIKKQ
tara:strand:- start:119580 stop:119975 length:396 start_codon:yes stop_codon:yes gene_type:complete